MPPQRKNNDTQIHIGVDRGRKVATVDQPRASVSSGSTVRWFSEQGNARITFEGKSNPDLFAQPGAPASGVFSQSCNYDVGVTCNDGLVVATRAAIIIVH